MRSLIVEYLRRIVSCNGELGTAVLASSGYAILMYSTEALRLDGLSLDDLKNANVRVFGYIEKVQVSTHTRANALTSAPTESFAFQENVVEGALSFLVAPRDMPSQEPNVPQDWLIQGLACIAADTVTLTATIGRVSELETGAYSIYVANPNQSHK